MGTMTSMGTDDREGADSRCCLEDGAPYEWKYWEDASDPSVLAYEAWLATLEPWAAENELGELDDLFEAARLGKLWDSGDETTAIKPIHADPDVYELRKQVLSKKMRYYHSEPAKYPALLLRLHHHIKIDKATQQVEIEKVVARYRKVATA